ncbi:hypothetical protein AB0D42_28060 [Streptomyces sp. NPDC048304]|uniref:hypothetical protein n=1 Tax=Streptomyces sp. NPDC048304 TaxID=3154820 RepID=UPI00340F32DF
MSQRTENGECARTAVPALVGQVLDAWSARPRDSAASAEHPSDPGVPALAALAHAVGGPGATRSAARAVAVWARTAGRGPGRAGLYDGGLAGTLVGLRLGARLHPGLHLAARPAARPPARHRAAARPPPGPCDLSRLRPDRRARRHAARAVRR